MEGDAGASRLNPPPMPIARRLRRLPRIPGRRIHQEPEASPESEVTAEGSPEPEAAAEEAGTEDTADSAEQPGAEETGTEEPDSAEESEPDTAEESEPEAAADAAGVERPPSRLGRGWLAAIAVVLVLFAGAVGGGGYFALRFHHDSQALARNDAAALKAAIDCVSATQAPDTSAMIASEQKIIDCGTDDFRSQALLYTSMIVQAYQASNVRVQVSDARAAVERNNTDGSVDVLVAMRVKVSNDQTQNETGYRLRVKMALEEGQYRISRLDTVTK